MNLVREWTRSFPELQKAAVMEAIEAASLAKVRRALSLVEELDADHRGSPLRVELLSTFNLEPIRPVLQLALSCLPSRPSLCLAPLDTIETSLSQSVDIDSSGPLGARLVIWRIEELLPEALHPFSNGFPEKFLARLTQVHERVERVISLHRKTASGVPLFISTLGVPVHVANRVSAAQDRRGLFGSIGSINQKIYELATKESGIYVLDLNAWEAREGRGLADPALEFMARQPLSASGQVSFAFFIAECLRPLIIPRRKALAIDLDNTLWGGVVGEDGVEGLILGHEFPGNVHLRIQRELLELQHRGVALVLLSKNNEADARQAFETLPEMLLQWDDFVVHKVDWNPKHENLSAAAGELGLGVDSFVFLDDSDYEREQMRQLLPEVMILNDSSDALQNLRTLWETDAFDSLIVSREDVQRHQDYSVRAKRDAGAHEDELETFLRSLEMEATIEEIGPRNVERVVTMLTKTNQFNLTTKRHSGAQVQAILEAPGSIALALRLRDKFGDQGIVALLLATPRADNRTLLIDSFLVSCRALGRGVELALWAAMVNRAHAQGVRRLEAEYRPTPKNSLVADLYSKLGLRSIGQTCSGIGFLLEPIERHQFPTWISVMSENNGP